jgi:hypothetical protein
LLVLRLKVFLIICLAGLLGLPAAAEGGRIVLLRHAERLSLFRSDSALSAQGQQRAANLATLLEGYHPGLLIASDKIRTQETLTPLANRLKLPIRTWAMSQTPQLAAWLKANASSGTTIVCWHHDHLQELARALGVPEPVPDWWLSTYDQLWIISLQPDGSATMAIKAQ